MLRPTANHEGLGSFVYLFGYVCIECSGGIFEASKHSSVQYISFGQEGIEGIGALFASPCPAPDISTSAHRSPPPPFSLVALCLRHTDVLMAVGRVCLLFVLVANLPLIVLPCRQSLEGLLAPCLPKPNEALSHRPSQWQSQPYGSTQFRAGAVFCVEFCVSGYAFPPHWVAKGKSAESFFFLGAS